MVAKPNVDEGVSGEPEVCRKDKITASAGRSRQRNFQKYVCVYACMSLYVCVCVLSHYPDM